MFRKVYSSNPSSPRNNNPEVHRSSIGWQKGPRQFGTVTPPRARKPLIRTSSFENDVKVPPVSRRDRSIIPAIPKFAEGLKSVEVREGAFAELCCKITGNPVPMVTWMKDRDVLNLPTDRMSLEVDDEQYILTINPAKAEDRGRYSCIASNRLGKANSAALLNVHISVGFNNAARKFGEIATPRSSTPSTPRSYKGSLRKTSNTEEKQDFNSCGDSIKSSDSGISRPSSRETNSSSSSFPPSVFSDCVSASSQGLFSPDSLFGSMGSSGDRPPQFTNQPRPQVVEEAESVTFDCKVDGSPKPTVSWFKGSIKLQPSDRIEISEKLGTYFLNIHELKATDAGTYKCVAMNRSGKSTVSFELRLAARGPTKSVTDAAPTFSQPLTEVEVNEGGRARFECKIEGKPKPTVTWEKDGKEITASSRVRIMEMYGTHSLVLSRTDHADTGTYSIRASNHVGNETCSAQLRVKESSYSSRSSTPRGRRSGQDSSEVATPTYSSSGSPATSALSSPSMSPKLGRAANSRLVSGSVSSWTTEKSRSSSGSGSSPRRRAPGFILRPRPQNVEAGEKLILKCTILGHPKPTIIWERDGTKFEDINDDRVIIREDGNDHYLEIEDCNADDAGKYSVQAKNSLGRQTATVDVHVLGAGSKGYEKPSRTVVHSNEITDKLNNNTTRGNKSQHLEITINSSNRNLASSRISTSSSRSISSNEDTMTSPYRSRRSNQVAPTFTRRLSSTQVLEGEDLELKCEITGTPTPELTWTKDGVPISNREANTNINVRNGVATLRVSGVKSSHAGEYLCLAKNDAGDSKCSSRVTVKTKQKQSKPKFTKPPKDVRIAEGETLTLEAEVSGMPSPEVLWSLDGEEISDGDCFYRNNIAKLVLRNVTMASSGQYMCTAINDAGEDSVACRVRIKQKRLDVPPEFTGPLSDIKTKEGEDICLKCMLTGTPEPRVQWCLNEEVLEPGDGLEMTLKGGAAILTLEQVTPEDSGCYSCIATNNEGRAQTSCQVVVSELPEKAPPIIERAPEFVSKFEEYTRAMEGDTVTFECQVRGSPEPEITWKIDRKLVKGAQQSFENGRAILTINSVTPDHGGNVVCTAKNAAGQSSNEGRLYIRAKREAPSFLTKLPESVEVDEGQEVTFGCQVKGHPQPRVTWTRNGRSLSVLNSETSYEEGKASVRIRKAGSSDGGKYVCTARNLSGESESVCVVTVCAKQEIKKPNFTKNLQNLNLEEGEDIRLMCEIANTPDLQIIWMLDGQKLEAEDGDASYKDGVARMVLEDAMKEDSGVYECIAKTKGGETKTSCKVNVAAKKVSEEGPSFPIQLEDMTIQEDQDILLKCQVKGNPRPTITWLLDGDPLTDADCKYAEDGHIELFLPEALPEDEGVYTCIAQNKLKRVMCSCKVTVKEHPKPPKRNVTPKVEPKEPVKSPASSKKSTPTTSMTHMNGTDGTAKVQSSHQAQSSEDETTAHDGPDRPPTFLEDLEDRIVPDGSINYRLTARVAGCPPPVVKWFVNDEEIEESDDFKYETDAETRTLVFAEIFPEDSGIYSCVAKNAAGEANAQMKMTVEEIDGDPPNFMLKPRPVTVNAGETALLTCKVDGEPTPTVKWLYCNRPITGNERLKISAANSSNSYTHSLEIVETRIEDAGRYAACSSNLLGDVTCTVSLIVNAAKKQEEKKDFRGVLKKSTSKGKMVQDSQPEQVDFRGVLKKTEQPLSPEPTSSKREEEQPDFREVLSRPVKTKVLSEDERKKLRAEQKDFRSNLVRKVETKQVTNDAIKVKQAEQKDFRDEALKTKVRTKAYEEDKIKSKMAEQKDFRGEALKTKVVTKAYKEENTKMKRAEQVDFREVLSPSKRHTSKDDPEVDTEETKSFELPAAPAKMKIKMDHTTVATRRTRTRGAEPTTRRTKAEREEPKGKAPEFLKALKNVTVNDSEPFELVCRVIGDPTPNVTWFLEDEEIQADNDISITRNGDECKVQVPESFPDDDGIYECRAENEYGVVKCSARVTVISDDPHTGGSAPQFVKKQTSVTEIVPACIKDGPKDTVIIRGHPVSLVCALGGTPPLKSVWRKGKNEIKSSSQCSIDITNTSAALTIRSGEKDDSGCYTLQVKNSAGVDQFSVNVSIVDVPDPPGKPYASDISGTSLVLSWYGTGYDGGSTITSYQVEIAEIISASSVSRKWSRVASTKSTSCTVKDLKPNSKYTFRICAENKYGVSRPGEESDDVINTVTEVVESSEDEDEHFEAHGIVVVKANENFSHKYETKERLGQGRFGKVHRVVHRETGKQYAAKIMRALKAKDKEAVQQEIDVMNSLRHPRLVQLIDAYSHGREITMVMDLVSGGELFERVIDEDFELTEAACIKYMTQICEGLKYMHDTLILHLDLKPENIMCINKTGTQVKIIDFGLARKYNPKEVIRVMFGTPEFVAPEVINYDAIGPQTDMWSVGVICYILLSGLSPFMGDNDSETLSNITAAEWDFEDEAFDDISYEAKDFIRKLLVKRLNQRYTVDKALEHKWLKKDINKMQKSKLNTKNLKRFLARRKWQKTGNAVRALGRLASLANLGSQNSNANKISNGQPRESGFLAALKAQLLRENEEEQDFHENCKPMFDTLFDDVEVIEGSAAKFECTIIGTPDPEIMWYKDGEPIKESRHFRISYTEDDVCTLLITDTTEADEAEYSCKAVNCEGETEHRAELIVITPVSNDSSDSLNSISSSSRSTSLSYSYVYPPVFWAQPGGSVAFLFESLVNSFDKKGNSSVVIDDATQPKWFRITKGSKLEGDSIREEILATCSNRIHIRHNQVKNGFPETTSVLVICNVSAQDEGSYECVDRNGTTTIKYTLRILKDSMLHKKSKGLSPQFVKKPQGQSVPERVNAVLQCSVLGNPAPIIQWYQYGTRVFPGTRYSFAEEGNNASLTILDTHWYDSAKYECRAINTLGETSCHVDLYVEPPEHQSVEFDGSPMFLTRTESAEFMIGDTVVFKCTVAGIPTPKIHWKKDGRMIYANSKRQMNLGQGGKHDLIIVKTGSSDEGKYECVAENERGVAHCVSFLKMNGESTIRKPLTFHENSEKHSGETKLNQVAPAFITRPHRAIVRSGLQAIFRCTVLGQPEPTVSWFRNGIQIATNMHFKVEDIFGHHCLRICSTKLSDQGTYMCTATNPIGEVSCSTQLEVKARENCVPPSIQFSSGATHQDEQIHTARGSVVQRNIEKPPKEVWVHAGKTIKLSLMVRGTPKPEVTWNKEGKRICSGNRYVVSSENDKYILKIVRVNKTDEGSYSVVAYNSAGITISNLIVHVRAKPVVPVFQTPPDSSITLHKCADAKIRCVLEETARESSAKWSKDNNVIVDQSTEKYEMNNEGSLRELVIKNVTLEDSGQYSCTVKDQTVTSTLKICDESSDDDVSSNGQSSADQHDSVPNNSDNLIGGVVEITPVETDETDSVVVPAKELTTSAQIITNPLPTYMKVPETGTLVIQHSVDKMDESFTWELNGTKLECMDRCTISNNENKYCLEMRQIEPEDAGEVTFKLENGSLCTTTLEVEALPTPPATLRLSQLDGQRVRLSWAESTTNSTSQICDVTKYVIEKKTLKEDAWQKVSEVSSTVNSYTIPKLLAEETYIFRVRSKNNVGISKKATESEKYFVAPQIFLLHGLENKEIDEGETAQFTVQLNRADVQAEWFLNGVKLVTRGESCQIHSTGKSHSLIMRNLSATGSARVEFSTVDKKITTVSNLIIKGKPVTVRNGLQDATMVENADVTFTVALSRNVRTLGQWRYKGKLLRNNHDIVIEKKAEYQTLTMKNVKGTGAGTVEFCLPDEAGAKSSAELYVKSWFDTEPFQKIVENPPETMSATPGEDVEIGLKISSSSKCRPKWIHNGQIIPPKSKKYVIKQEDDLLKLIIKDVEINDSGIIECTVDKDQCQTKIIVEEQAQIEQIPEPEANLSKFLNKSKEGKAVLVNLNEGQEAGEIRCKVQNAETEVVWMKDGKPIDFINENIQEIIEGKERILRFSNIELSTSGKYQCCIKSDINDCIEYDIFIKERHQVISTKLPSMMEVVLYQDLKLRVTLEDSNSKVKWLKNGKLILTSSSHNKNKGATISQRIKEEVDGDDPNQRILAINHVTKEDAGKYTCETKHDSTTVEIIVEVPPLEVVEQMSDVEIYEKDTASFQITLSRKPTDSPTWKLNDKRIVNSNRSQVTCSGTTCSVTVRMLMRPDSGVVKFQCEDLVATATLSVKAPPAIFSKPISNISVLEGKDAIFTCEVSAESATVEWRKGEEVLKNSQKYGIAKVGRSRTLNVKNILFDDAGMYECHTEVDATEAKLTVEAPILEIVEDIEDVETTLSGNASFTLNLSLPNVQVTWFRDGKVLRNVEKRIQIASEGRWHALHMRKLELKDSGLIRVKVEDKILTEAVLVVKKPPPIFTKELFDQVIDLKKTATFLCEVSDAEANVIWYRDDIEIVPESEDNSFLKFRLLNEGTVRKLTIERTSVHHEGKYSCIIADSGYRCACELFVRLPNVKIIKELQNVEVYVGEEAEFRTEVSCAEVDGEWMLDNVRLHLGDNIEFYKEHELRVLKISNVKDSAAVSFKAAKNVVSTCKLTVSDRPVNIVRRLSDTNVRVGDNIILECEFNQPGLDAVWLYDGEKIEESEKMSISIEGTKHILKLTDARYDDEGNYTCRYKNRRTSAEIKIREPRVHVIEELHDVTLSEGMETKLECTLSYSGAEVTWKKDGEIVGTEIQTYTEKGEHFSKHTLLIVKSQISSSAIYEILMGERLLSTSKVVVRPAPVTILREMEDAYVRDDVESTQMECEFSGSTDVVWKKDHKKLKVHSLDLLGRHRRCSKYSHASSEFRFKSI
uniref:muscle M-line assembly protein unc-89-like n=1 Tax=Styela clava TaxID=7725 RepID=UPI00193A4E43|nr:muscle M-line assembly protein unc-89-like [Styela clava]